MYIHCIRRFADMFRQRPVRLAGMKIPGRVIMYHGYLRSPLQQRFPENGTHISISPVYAAGTDTYLVNQFSRLIQE